MILEKEINEIKDIFIRHAVTQYVQTYEDFIKRLPATVSGKYHPPEERGPGGHLLHIRRMCKIVTDGMDKHFGLTEHERDLLLAGIILHDASVVLTTIESPDGKMYKDEKMFEEWHSDLSWALVSKYFIPLAIEKDMLELKAMVESHMGFWYEKFRKPVRKLEILLSALDYIDTRPYVHVEV